jgi:ABC-type amino acid transport substrate-binding protein
MGALWLKGKGPFKDLASLAGKRVSVIHGTYTESVVREQVPTATVIPVDAQETVLETKLRDGEADVHLAYYTRLQFVMKSEDALIQPMKSTFALRRNETELRDAINQTLAAMWKDGSLKKIKKRHLEPLGIEPANHP